MKLIIHDGNQEYEAWIRENFLEQGEKAEIVTDNGTIINCIGCFGCWVKTPGRCVLKDDYNRMGEMMAHAEELIIISRCVYGTYSPFVRNILDRCLPYIHPYFTKREKEIHHKARYFNRLRTSVYFYGDCTEEEKKTALRTVKANVLNFNGILEHISFSESREQIKAKGNKKGTAAEMKIAMVNGSPKAKDSASGAILSMLKEYCNQEVMEISLNKTQMKEQEIAELLKCDAIVIAFPLYIDSVPSHLLRCLVQVEEYVHLHGLKKEIKTYVIINNGFFQGKQTLPAIEVMKHWADRCGFSFGKALGVGGGGMINYIKTVPEGHGPKKNLTRGLKEIAEDIAQMKTNDTNDNTVSDRIRVFELNYPAWAYKWQGEYGWRLSAKKNGLKRKDLDKQW